MHLRLLLLTIVFCFFASPANAGSIESPASGPGLTAHKDKDKDDDGGEDGEEMSEEELAALQRKKDRAARVVVLKWPGTEVDYQDETLRRSVRNRIDRPDALFFPSVDLYQNGRKVPDKTVVPANQPAEVPASNLAAVMTEVERVRSIPWDAMAPSEWGLTAQSLIRLTDSIWFVDSVEEREPLFLLYTTIGYAAENSNNPAPPFYEAIGGQFVNYYFYLAATMAFQDSSLLSKVTDQELNAAISFYVDQLKQGVYPTFDLDFELENEWDEESFVKEYEILLNGLPIIVDSEEAEYPVPLGRLDIYLKRLDTGHGLSEKLVVDKLEEKNYFVRDVARKKMGVDFIDQLMLHPNECTPELDGDILNFLSIYAKIHPSAEIYIAVPKEGDPNKTWIWRYDRTSATLQLVGGGNDGFPVRFALVAQVGALYNGAAVTVDSNVDNADLNSALDPDPGAEAASRSDVDLQAASLPVNLELRGHYNRLMVAAGMEHAWNMSSDGLWVERYWTPVHKGGYEDGLVVVEDVEAGGEELPNGNTKNGPEVYHYRAWSRMWYGSVGVVFGRDAALGFGPRLALRAGGTNMPLAFQTTGHFGWSFELPIPGTNLAGRVRPLVEFDARGGVSIPGKSSIQREYAAANDEGFVKPVFGLTAGIGTTF